MYFLNHISYPSLSLALNRKAAIFLKCVFSIIYNLLSLLSLKFYTQAMKEKLVEI